MNYKWLNKKNNTKLIIFFNGWGMDDCVVKHLDFEDYDLLMFYNYNNIHTTFDFNLLDSYEETNIVSWSMGVMVASLFSQINATKKVAINGTLKPIDEKYGIHPKVYDLTIKGFNEKGREKFVSSMFENKEQIKNIFFSERELSEQHKELISLKSIIPNFDFKYDKIYISENDKIIPTKSQIEFWGIKPNLKGGHCPFFNHTKWGYFL